MKNLIYIWNIFVAAFIWDQIIGYIANRKQRKKHETSGFKTT